jgi:hypothetical protein
MNTIGKILVILNLVFALLVGGFLVIDFATRSNWKVAYEKLKSEMEIAQLNYKVSGDTIRGAITVGKTDRAENDTLKQKLVDQEVVAKAREASLLVQVQEAVDKTKDADLNAQKAIAEKDRLKEEVKGLNLTVQGRDGTILTLQNDNKRIRTEAVAQENIAKAMQSRNENLLARLQELERKIIQNELGTAGPLAKDPSAPNPPPAYIKGKIDKINPDDRRLVQISIGTDQGLNLNHTLEVYRLSPKAEYLGMIRIVDAKEHTAVGQLVRTGISGNRAPLQVGDTVASSLK